jgi:hypothetical protein
MVRLNTQRFQVTIGQLMIVIAVCAVGLWSPNIIIVGSALAISWFLVVGAIYSQKWRRIAEWCAFVAVILVLFALCQPPVVSHRRSGAPAASLTAALQRTPPAPAHPGQSPPLPGEPGH